MDNAPSYFGHLSVRYESRIAGSEIKAMITPPERNRPKNIYVRFRHPTGKQIKAVTVNGKAYDQFDAAKEWVVLPGTIEGLQEIVAKY